MPEYLNPSGTKNKGFKILLFLVVHHETNFMLRFTAYEIVPDFFKIRKNDELQNLLFCNSEHKIPLELGSEDPLFLPSRKVSRLNLFEGHLSSFDIIYIVLHDLILYKWLNLL